MGQRERDEIWDALEEHFGPVRTKEERGRRNAAVKSLRDAEATPEEVRIACDWCRVTFAVYSEMAVVTNFSRAQYEAEQSVAIDNELRRMLEGT